VAPSKGFVQGKNMFVNLRTVNKTGRDGSLLHRRVTKTFLGPGDVIVKVRYDDGTTSIELVQEELVRKPVCSELTKAPICAQLEALPPMHTKDRSAATASIGAKISPVPVFREAFLRAGRCNLKNPDFFHGRLLSDRGLQAPERMWSSAKPPRDDFEDQPGWLKSSEYRDLPEVLDIKVTELAKLLRMSQNTVVYSGAGISVAADIPMYAAGEGKDNEDRMLNTLPTKAHYLLAQLARAGLIHDWVQQNHDGLPQKAGFPQQYINEVHGALYDPCNPVVQFDGNLKGDENEGMCRAKKDADLVLVLGTSLNGLNADGIAHEANERAVNSATATKRNHKTHCIAATSLGSVFINLQQTEYDGQMTLKVNETIDIVLARVVEKLGLGTASMCEKCGERFCRERNGYMYSRKNNNGDHRWDLLLKDLTMECATSRREQRSHPTLRNGEPLTYEDMCQELRRRGSVPDGFGSGIHFRRMWLKMKLVQDEFPPHGRDLPEAAVHPPPAPKTMLPRSRRIIVPYNQNGDRVGPEEKHHMVWDLSSGAAIKLHSCQNWQGAAQPCGGLLPSGSQPSGVVLRPKLSDGAFEVEIQRTDGRKLTWSLGFWYLEAARKGELKYLPVINNDPKFVEVDVVEEAVASIREEMQGVYPANVPPEFGPFQAGDIVEFACHTDKVVVYYQIAAVELTSGGHYEAHKMRWDAQKEEFCPLRPARKARIFPEPSGDDFGAASLVSLKPNGQHRDEKRGSVRMV